MAIYSPRASGLGNSAAYQVAGKPYLTGSLLAFENGVNLSTSNEYKVTFPTVTKRVTISNYATGSNLAVYFSPKATSPATITGVHYYVIACTDQNQATGSLTLDIKCSELYISPLPKGNINYVATGQVGGDSAQGHQEAFAVVAELTGIPASEMYQLTGSGINVSTYTDGQN